MTENEACDVVKPFGFTARKVPIGFFLAPVSKNRFGHIHIGSDQMLVKHNGSIVVYEHDAQAFLAADVLGDEIVERRIEEEAA